MLGRGGGFQVLSRWGVRWSPDGVSRMLGVGLRGSSPELFHQHSSTSAHGSFPPGRKRRAQANLPAQAVSGWGSSNAPELLQK